MEWQHRTYRLTVLSDDRAFWQAPGSAVKRHPSEMPRGLRKAWRETVKANRAATEAPQQP